MLQPNDLSRSLAALNQNSTLVAVIEISQTSWLVGAIVPGVERHPLKKVMPDEEALLRLLHRWPTLAASGARWLGARWRRASGRPLENRAPERMII